MKFTTIFCVILGLLMLVTPVLADTHEVIERGLMANGPTGILVPLGIENTGIPQDWVYLCYNFIAVSMLFFIASMASQRNSRFFGILLVVFAALLTFLGWFNAGGDKTQTWGLIGLCALIAAGLYMKGANKESNGIAGPGNTLINFVFFMIVLQASIGIVNSTNIWNAGNTAVTPDKWQNVDLNEALPVVSESGGVLGDLAAAATVLATGAIATLKLIMSILITIAAFSVTLYIAFPWLAGNPYALALLGGIQVVIYLMYAWFFFTLTFKPMPEGGYI